MLIIAIPKSASTSLMLTLGKYHNLEAKQDFSFSKNRNPENCQFLYKLHSDVRNLIDKDVSQVCNRNIINKQHIYPSSNNLLLFSNIKKVILLRSPDDIILAYRRSAMMNKRKLLPGYSIEMTENEWLEKSKSEGLYSDLMFFYEEWKEKAVPENTLFVHYQEYLQNPKTVLNKIEEFYELPLTQQKVKTIRARYSRRNGIDAFIFNYKSKGKNAFKWLLVQFGIENNVKQLLTGSKKH